MIGTTDVLGDLDSQIPAEGIMTVNEWGKTKTYRVSCDCGCEDDEHIIEIEVDDISVSVTLYTTQKTDFWSINRWKHMWQLLTKGYVKTRSDILMTRQTALNYATTLKAAVDDVKKLRNEQFSK